MYNALMKIMDENSGKKVVVVTHSTAIMFLLRKWCDIEYDGNYIYNGNIFFNGKWNYLETFKLEFEDNNINSICNINYRGK